MSIRKSDPIASAQRIAAGGLSLFADAHAEISRACDIFEAAHKEHTDKAAEHLAEAGRAKSLLEQHQASAEKIAALLP